MSKRLLASGGGKMNKCIASKDGACQNINAFGLRCDGYSTKCKLKPAYDSLERASSNLVAKLRKAFGIVGDKE